MFVIVLLKLSCYFFIFKLKLFVNFVSVSVFLINTDFKDFSCIKHYALQNVSKLLAGRVGTEFRSEKIPRNRLGTVSVIPRKKALIPRHSKFRGRAISEAWNHKIIKRKNGK